MSLHTLAHHLQAAGRGDDKVLVHMTPKEVHGLQALAMSHGGSLTINPHTGLPEAGFLSALLPMVAGFALGPAGFGLVQSAMGAGLLVGGATGLATGSLRKGLMAGLGAYGGAGLGQALSTTGNSALNVQNAMSGKDLAYNLGNQGAAFGSNLGTTTETLGTNLGSTAGSTGTTASSFQGFTPAGASMGPAPYASAVSNTVPVGAPVPETSAMFNPPPPAAPPVSGTPLPGSEGILKSPMLTGSAAPSYASTASSAAGVPVEPSALDKVSAGFKQATGSWEGAKGLYEAMPTGSAAALGISALDAARPEPPKPHKDNSLIRPYEYNRTVNEGSFDTGAPIWADQPGSSREKTYFTESMVPLTPYKAPGPEYKAAEGGLTALAVGGPVETMSAQNAVGGNLMYPQANINTPMYSNPSVQRPEAVNIVAPAADAGVGAYSGEARFALGGLNKNAEPALKPMFSKDRAKDTEPTYQYSYDPNTLQFTQTKGPDQSSAGLTTLGGISQPVAQNTPAAPAYTPPPIPAYQSPEQQLGLGGFYDNMNSQLGMMGYADGGISHLGDYSDGGRLLKGPGDGVSDSIPASIGNRQPARLADGEFVVPARIVSELGNGSTEAGAKRLYAMMDRVQKARRKTVGKNRVATNTNAEKYLPA